MNKYSQKELSRRVSEVLYYLWDPIGVSTAPEARSEYEDYVPQMVGMLERNEDAQELAKLLSNIRTNTMGLPENFTKDIETAELLQEHKDALLQRLA
jgi:hypothetical protein